MQCTSIHREKLGHIANYSKKANNYVVATIDIFFAEYRYYGGVACD